MGSTALHSRRMSPHLKVQAGGQCAVLVIVVTQRLRLQLQRHRPRAARPRLLQQVGEEVSVRSIVGVTRGCGQLSVGKQAIGNSPVAAWSGTAAAAAMVAVAACSANEARRHCCQTRM